MLVRDEYRTALQTLDTDSYRREAFVIGQRGIGKSWTTFGGEPLTPNQGKRLSWSTHLLHVWRTDSRLRYNLETVYRPMQSLEKILSFSAVSMRRFRYLSTAPCGFSLTPMKMFRLPAASLVRRRIIESLWQRRPSADVGRNGANSLTLGLMSWMFGPSKRLGSSRE